VVVVERIVAVVAVRVVTEIHLELLAAVRVRNLLLMLQSLQTTVSQSVLVLPALLLLRLSEILEVIHYLTLLQQQAAVAVVQ
jgi:hypothetical protein